MPRKELLKGISRNKMTGNQKNRFEGMCEKLGGRSAVLGERVRCELGDRRLEIRNDYSRAEVRTTQKENNPNGVSGQVEDVDNISMAMIGDPETDGDVAKQIIAEGDNGKVKLTNFDAPAGL